MNRAEQARLVEELVPLEYKMSAKDKDLFFGLHKRHKDDEDLDSASADQLRRIHATYRPPKSKKELEDMWSKLAAGPKKP